MQVAQGEGANKKCQLFCYSGGHCVLTLGPGARIWLSLTPSLCVLFTFLFCVISWFPFNLRGLKKTSGLALKGNVNIEPVLAVVMHSDPLCAPTGEQCILHWLETLLLHHYLFKVTETAWPCVALSQWKNISKNEPGHEYTMKESL